MRRSHVSRRRNAAFTLMEVLLVLVILVVLASLAGVFLAKAQQQANHSAAQSQIGLFKGPLDLYYQKFNQYPTTEQGLQALIVAPADLKQPEKWYQFMNVPAIPVDPWSQPYQYERSSRDQYRIWSMGPDEQDGTDDDITL